MRRRGCPPIKPLRLLSRINVGASYVDLSLAKLNTLIRLSYFRSDDFANLLDGQIRLTINALLLALASCIAISEILKLPDRGDVEVGAITEVGHVGAVAAAKAPATDASVEVGRPRPKLFLTAARPSGVPRTASRKIIAAACNLSNRQRAQLAVDCRENRNRNSLANHRRSSRRCS